MVTRGWTFNLNGRHAHPATNREAPRYMARFLGALKALPNMAGAIIIGTMNAMADMVRK